MSEPGIKKRRLQAAHRLRRIILNTDAGSVHDGDPAHPERFLDRRVTGLHETHVDTISFCTDYGFNHYTHNSKVSQVVNYRSDFASPNPDDPGPDIIHGLIKKGTDTLEVAIRNCHGNGMEIFWSMRMNDEHDAWIRPAISQWKKDHPECLFGAEDKPPRHGVWTGVDYAQAAVRDQAFAILHDVCSRYDIDGIELDYFKDLTCFKSMAWGHSVSDEERDMMTDLLRRVREMTDEIGRQRGRPLLIAARVPDSAGFGRAIGLDVQQWMQQDLIDIYIPTGYFRLQPWRRTLELAGRYEVPVYPCMEQPRVCEWRRPDIKEPPKVRRLNEAFCADALNMWRAGADGIYMFNFHYYHPSHALWRLLGDPEMLDPVDKIYFVSVMGKGHNDLNHYLTSGDRFLHIPVLCPDHAQEIYTDVPLATTIAVGDDLQTAVAADMRPTVRVNVRVEPLSRSDELTVRLNGHPLARAALTWTSDTFRSMLADSRMNMTGATDMVVEDTDGLWGQWCEYEVDPETVIAGSNRIDVTVAGDRLTPCMIHDVQLRISYRLGNQTTQTDQQE